MIFCFSTFSRCTQYTKTHMSTWTSGRAEWLAQDESSHCKQLLHCGTRFQAFDNKRCRTVTLKRRETQESSTPSQVSPWGRQVDYKKWNPRECGIPAELKRCALAVERLWALGHVRQGMREEGTVQRKGTTETSWEWSPMAPVQDEISWGLVENGCYQWESWAKIP